MNEPAPAQSSASTTRDPFLPTFFLALFLGIFGAHRFYVGKVKSGIAQLLTFGGLGIWAFIDIITILIGKFKTQSGLIIPNTHQKLSWGTLAVVFIIGVASDAGGTSIDGEYIPENPDPELVFESLEIQSGTLVYVAATDSVNRVGHRGIYSVKSAEPEKTELECGNAEIELVINDKTARVMKAQFIATITNNNGKSRLRYRCQNLESRKTMSVKYFIKKD